MKNKIRFEREKQGLTQTQLAGIFKKLGINISKASLSKYENDLRNPSSFKWEQMAKYFEVSVPYLKGEGRRSPKNKVPKIRLYLIRERLGFTQDQLAKYLNDKGLKISRGTIAKYESGVNFPSHETLKRLAQYLNVSVEFLSGNGLSVGKIEDALLNLLQDSYFHKDKVVPQLSLSVINFLEIKQINSQPYKFYLTSNGKFNPVLKELDFPRYSKIDEFWKRNFNFMFDDKNFCNSLIGAEKKFVEYKMIKKTNERYDRLLHQKKTKQLINSVNCLASVLKKSIYDEDKGFSGETELKKQIAKNIAGFVIKSGELLE